MFKIGLTGGIGSGKSRVAEFFEAWGASVIDTDVIAHELTAPGGRAIDAIRNEFGSTMVAADGSLDRAAMRELVFRDPGARTRLEAILHPMIGQVTREQAEQAKGCYVVFVVPLLVESGRWRDTVDRICVVDCDPLTQIARVRHRSGLTQEAIERIMSVQVSRETRLAAADDIIVNDGATTLDQLEARSRVLHDGWCKLAARHDSPGHGKVY